MPAGLDGTRQRIDSADRRSLVEALADDVVVIGSTTKGGMVLVGIDGVDGAGKSTLADELAERLVVIGRSAVRASIDSFHRPRQHRYQRGRTSGEGFTSTASISRRSAAACWNQHGQDCLLV